MVVKKGIPRRLTLLWTQSRPIPSRLNGSDDIARVATVSSGDETIGQLIAEAMEKVSADGVITVEESKTAETDCDVVEGMQFDRGYVSPYMCTDTDKMEAVIDDAYPAITIRRFPTSRRFCRCWSRCCRSGKKLVIIAEDIEGEALPP